MPRLKPHEFAKTVILVKLKYGLTIDRREKKALDRALNGRTSDGCYLISVEALKREHPLELWDDNRNGQDHLCRSPKARDRPGAPHSPSVRLHAGRRRRRLGLRVGG